MIPLNTPPGTEIVCVDDSPGRWKHPAYVRPSGGMDGLSRGAIYTVRDFVMTVHGVLSVRLNEIARPIRPADVFEVGFLPERFRLLEVHPSLTALLDANPVDVKRLLETEGL